MSNLEAENQVGLQDGQPEVDSNPEHAFVKPEVGTLCDLGPTPIFMVS